MRVTRDQVAELPSPEAVFELLNGDALEQYDAKEEQIGAEQLREIERRVMLSVIDQHWREHLYEMDYLREGINLRAMGQQDPLAEWQREGFDMFEAMMESIKDDFVRYIFRLEVVADDAPAPAREEPAVLGGRRTRCRGAAASRPPRPRRRSRSSAVRCRPRSSRRPDRSSPVQVEKLPGRNEPCYCGSGKKYKQCHGR